MSSARRSAVLGVLLCAAIAGCGRKGPPSGGPPDLDPPRLVSTSPDSGAALVPRDAEISMTFSEGMEPRSTSQAVSIAPRVDIRQVRWKSRTMTVVLSESLKADQTYILFVGNTARDRHGNPLYTGASLPFTTAAQFPAGRISGTVKARGFPAAGTYIWCYDAATGRAPDSTARDFDALGLADEKGHFDVLGLDAPGQYRLWVFADLNSNRSFEPATDVLTAADSVFVLSPEAPAIFDLELVVTNPRAPAMMTGTVLDTLGDSLGVVRVFAESQSDSLRRVSDDVDDSGGFLLSLQPGTWRVRAYRDIDKNRQWREGIEPASFEMILTVAPADEIKEVTLVLARPGGVPSGP